MESDQILNQTQLQPVKRIKVMFLILFYTNTIESDKFHPFVIEKSLNSQYFKNPINWFYL
ncbi:11335_t:CDS:2 [Funneliformis mosseae]|uniref:11335_t:CDS:1 n=1 Tax=Funneliformis mosseae TaxID=27381 RepID=A0A9N9BEV7_FUNMO|nr:11335_t:CDS:2 [Funneliformis mosseae]